MYSHEADSNRRYNEQRTGSFRTANNRDNDYDNEHRGGIIEGVKNWFRGDDNDREYNERSGYNRDYDRSYNDRSYGGNSNRFNVTGQRVDYDRDYYDRNTNNRNVRYGGGYGGSYGTSGAGYGNHTGSYGYGGNTTRDYDTTQRTTRRSYSPDRSYGRSYDNYNTGSRYGGNRGAVAVYGGSGSNDYDRLYGNTNNTQVARRGQDYHSGGGWGFGDLFSGLSLLSDRDEAQPSIVEENGARQMQWQFDVKGFNLDDITISDAGSNKLEISGRHEDNGAHHRHAKQFTRIVTLPQGTTAKDVKSRISSRGLLNVTVPYSGKSLQDYNTRELTVGTGGNTGSSYNKTGTTSSSSKNQQQQQFATTGYNDNNSGVATTTTSSSRHVTSNA